MGVFLLLIRTLVASCELFALSHDVIDNLDSQTPDAADTMW